MSQSSTLSANSARSALRSLVAIDRSEPRNSVRAMNRPISLAMFGQLAPFDQRAPQDDVRRRQILHDDQRLAFIEMIDRRHRAGRARLLPGQRVIFEEGALQRQRPAVADQADIGQGLLDDGAHRWRPRR